MEHKQLLGIWRNACGISPDRFTSRAPGRLASSKPRSFTTCQSLAATPICECSNRSYYSSPAGRELSRVAALVMPAHRAVLPH
jgi:hypothetical protein